MALILCPECNKEISSKATACPSCGCPLESGVNSTPVRPNIAADLSIGRQVWGSSTIVSGFFDPKFSTDQKIPEGKGSLHLYKKGIQVVGKLYFQLMNLHFSQFMSVEFLSGEKLVEKDKSVIKRAIVGTLILGPLGGVVGGMSGLGSKRKQFAGTVVINYWDIEGDSPYTLLLFVKKESEAKSFCDNARRKIAETQGVQNRIKEQQSPHAIQRKIYISRGGQTFGPYTRDELRFYLNEGSVIVSDLACQDGQNWLTVGDVLR